MKTPYIIAIILLMVLSAGCKYNAKQHKETEESLLPENDPFNQEFVPQDRYNFDYSTPSAYGNLLEENDEWGTIQNSTIKFDSFVDIDTIHYTINEEDCTFINFIKLEYAVGGISKAAMNKINNTIKENTLPTQYLKASLQEGAKKFITHTAKQHIEELTNRETLNKGNRPVGSENLQISLKINTIRVDKEYYGVLIHLDTQSSDSKLLHLNFNTTTGDLIELDDILKPNDSAAKKQFQQLVNDKIKAIFGKENVTKEFPLPSNFYLTSSFIAICFNYYEFTPIGEGPQTIYITYEEAKALLNTKSPYLIDSFLNK